MGCAPPAAAAAATAVQPFATSTPGCFVVVTADLPLFLAHCFVYPVLSLSFHEHNILVNSIGSSWVKHNSVMVEIFQQLLILILSYYHLSID